ncbi:MAG: EamA family transporter [Oscillospiraceae bacterium]|nr:EamA family transporter [Oscillospiraceae bacterium]
MIKPDKKIMTKTPVVAVLAFICCAFWGSAFPCIKIGYELFDVSSGDIAAQILFAGCRFSLAGVMAIILCSIGAKKLLRPSNKEEVGMTLKLCMFQTVLQYVFFYIGLAHAEGSKSAIIEGANVFVCVLMATLVFRIEKMTPRKLIGCIVGFAGVVIINFSGGTMSMDMSILGEGFVFISTFAYAASSIIMKSYSRRANPVMLSGWQFLAGGVILIIAGLLAGGRLTVLTPAGAGMLLYLAFISAAAYSLWAMLLKYNPVSKVTVFGFMNPVCGVLLSALLLGESGQAFGLRSAAALVLVCLGIYIVNRKEA